jgi:hypothetical protein
VYVLTLVARTSSPVVCGAVLESFAVERPPDLVGSRGRQWQTERELVRGTFLFEDLGALEAFADRPKTDPVAAALAPHIPAHGFEREAVQELPSGNRFERPIFIISAPRAGSSLLYQLLAQATDVWSLGVESRGVIEGIPRLHPANRDFDTHRLTDADADPPTARALRDGFLASVRDRSGRRYMCAPEDERPAKLRLLEKTPENSLRVSFLNAVFPDALFVFLHRDARQNVSSLIEAWHSDGFVNLPRLPGWPPGRWCFLLPPGWRSLRGAPLTDVAAYQWYAANMHALDDLIGIPSERWTVVEYADLVVATESVIHRVCEFLGIAIGPQMADALSREPPLSATSLTPPSPVKWRTNPEFRETSLANMGPLMGRLRSLTTPSAPRRSAPERVSSARFACFLDDLATSPDRGRATPALIVNPSFQLQMGATVPLAILRRTRHRERFLADQPLLWVEDAATEILYPFWVRRTEVWGLRALRPGCPLPPTLSSVMAARLEAAGVLTTKDRLTARLTDGQTLATNAHVQFERERWCRIAKLLHPGHVSALGVYYRGLIESGLWQLGDEQVDRRHGWYNEPVAQFFHTQLSAVVGRIAGEPVKPTYAYASAYRGGAALRAHMDRKQCEYTLSLLVDRSSDVAHGPWPLWFHGPNGKASVTLESGDAVLFRGCELPHWRDAAPSDQNQTMLLFHFVPLSFSGVLD